VAAGKLLRYDVGFELPKPRISNLTFFFTFSKIITQRKIQLTLLQLKKNMKKNNFVPKEF